MFQPCGVGPMFASTYPNISTLLFHYEHSRPLPQLELDFVLDELLHSALNSQVFFGDLNPRPLVQILV